MGDARVISNTNVFRGWFQRSIKLFLANRWTVRWGSWFYSSLLKGILYSSSSISKLLISSKCIESFRCALIRYTIKARGSPRPVKWTSESYHFFNESLVQIAMDPHVLPFLQRKFSSDMNGPPSPVHCSTKVWLRHERTSKSCPLFNESLVETWTDPQVISFLQRKFDSDMNGPPSLILSSTKVLFR
jgi:hypothetical protein